MKRVSFVKLFLGVALAAGMVVLPGLAAAEGLTLYFAPDWKAKADKAKSIAEVLSKESGLEIRPQIAATYPQIIEAFTKQEKAVVYVGSFVQAILYARDLIQPLARGVSGGKELYSSVMIAPDAAGADAAAIIKGAEGAISYAIGASSGESGAKAASEGKASLGVNNHEAAANAVKVGKTKAAFVKNHWWDGHAEKFPGMKMHEIPGVSDQKNHDFLVSASKSVTAEDATKVKAAIKKNAAMFDVQTFEDFDVLVLGPSLGLMMKGRIDPKAYTW